MSNAQDIEATAAQWLMRRDAGQAKECPEFTAWLAADPRHRAGFLRLAAAWESTAQLKRLRPEGSSVDPDLLLPRSRRRRAFRSWSPLGLAAGVAIAALSTVWWVVRDTDGQTYRTEVGGLSRVVLADGSTVTLNTDTEVRVHLARDRREITLTRGEAQFTVAHDVTRPFEVSAAGRIVRAVGTAFDVRLGPDEALQVMVTEGRVAVEGALGTGRASRAPVATVAAGETATADRSQFTVRRISATESSRRLAWQEGELSFQGESLTEAVREFNRYNRRKLRIEDTSVAQLQVGGNFRALDVESFVLAVERSFNLSAKLSDDGSLILERAADASRP